MPPAAVTASFRRRVLGGETVFGLFLDLASPLAAELCARAGYDWLLIDLEHGGATEADLLGLIHATAVRRAVADRAGARSRSGGHHGAPARVGGPGA